MTNTGIENLDKSVHKTNEWINEVMIELGWNSKKDAFNALKGALHIIRNRLNIEEASEVGAQLPALLRGYYYDGWQPSKPLQKFDRQTLINRVNYYLPHISEDPELILRGVLKVLGKKFGGEMQDIKASMPKDIKEIFD